MMGNRSPAQAHMALRNAPVKPKKLPESVQLTFAYDKAMPLSWKKFLRDVAYWHTELEE